MCLGIGQTGEGVLEHFRQRKSRKCKAQRQKSTTPPHPATGVMGRQKPSTHRALSVQLRPSYLRSSRP